MNVISFVIPVVIFSIILYGIIKKVDILGEFMIGAKEGVMSLLGIAPNLLLMLTALSMFRASGAVDWLVEIFKPLCGSIGIPPELVPLGLMRPISGSGSIAQLSEYLQTYGPDSHIGRMASVLAASSETTVYTYGLYTVAAKVKKLPYALTCGLIADACSLLFSVLTVRIFFG